MGDAAAERGDLLFGQTNGAVEQWNATDTQYYISVKGSDTRG